MSPRKKNWIAFTTPEGENKLGSPSFLKKLLGFDKLEALVWRLKEDNRVMSHRVIRLESPFRQAEVIELLSQEETPHNFTWLKNRVDNLGFRDLEPLIESGVLRVTDRAGHRMFTLEEGSD